MEDRRQIKLYKQALVEHEAELARQREEEARRRNSFSERGWPKPYVYSRPTPEGEQDPEWKTWLKGLLIFGPFLLIVLATIALYLIGFARLGI